MSDANDRVRRAARAALDGDRRGLGTLVELGYEEAVRGVEAALPGRARRADVDGEHALTRFFVDKLASEEFLEHLAAAPYPLALLRKAAHHFSLDLLKRASAVQEAAPRALASDEDPALSADDERVEAIEAADPDLHADRRAFCDSLPREHRVLLRVLYVERAPLADEDVEWLAERRGTTTATIREELDARATAIDAHRAAAGEEVERRSDRLLALHHRHDAVQRLVQQLDGTPARPDGDISPERVAQLRTASALARAQPGERAAVLERLERRIAVQDRLRTEAQSKLEHELALRPGYEEVARIMGLFPPDASEAERRKVVNTLTVTVLRLRQRLREKWRLR